MIVTIKQSPSQRRSRPVWGAWIEIGLKTCAARKPCCRAPYGARGLKYPTQLPDQLIQIVAPRMGRVD